MSDLGTAVSLLQAVIDLKAVKSIRAAIRINTLKQGGVEGPLGNIENPKPARGQIGIDPQPRYEPRRLFHPSPQIDSRDVHHRMVERPALIDLRQPLPPEQTSPSAKSKGPLLPPWQLPLPIAQPPTIKVVKYGVSSPDLKCKGQMIDTFI